MTTQHVETLIVGAGQAGLATGYHLARLGRGFLIVDGSGRRATTGAATTTRSGSIRRRGSTGCRAWSSRGIRDTSQARTRLRTSSSSTPWRWSYRCECRLGWIDTYPETVVDSPPTWGPRRSSATAQWSPPGHSAASRGCWRWPRRCPPGSGSSTPRRPDTGLPEVSSSREPVARAENRYSGQVGVMPGQGRAHWKHAYSRPQQGRSGAGCPYPHCRRGGCWQQGPGMGARPSSSTPPL